MVYLIYKELPKFIKTNNPIENQAKGHELAICRGYKHLLILTSNYKNANQSMEVLFLTHQSG